MNTNNEDIQDAGTAESAADGGGSGIGGGSQEAPLATPAAPEDVSSPVAAGQADAAAAPAGNKDKKSPFVAVLEFLGELIHVVIISLAVIIPIRYFLIQPFYVKGASMEPSFYDHEYLIIDEIDYRFSNPHRGDIIVFRYPNDPRQFFIKRVIGLPGERGGIADGAVKIYEPGDSQGKVLDETAYLGSVETSGSKDITLGSGDYFVMGDNRGASLDSRVFGAVPREFIVGRVWLRGRPPEKIHVFNTQATQ